MFSFVGGLISFIALIFIAPPLAQLDAALLAGGVLRHLVFALTMIAALSSGSMIKGLLSGMLG